VILAVSVIAYLLLNIIIGYSASKKIRTAEDFAVAGRRLPFFMASSAFFATWFGSETILGATGEFLENGVLGIIEEPLGAALCLILVGVFYARKIYRSGAITFSDLFRDRFGMKAELVSAIVMIPSFFTWIAAQFLALGMIFHVLFGVELWLAVLIGALLVVLYTSIGGMWAVSMTDSLQMVVIVMGLLLVFFYLYDDLQSKNLQLIDSQIPMELYNNERLSVWNWLGAWITVGLGAIASQDIFQRVVASRSDKVAVYSSIFSGALYLVIGIVPLNIVWIGQLIYPDLYAVNKENFITTLITVTTPGWVQVIFFGALISAILSTASGALLAPSTVLAENILKPLGVGRDLLLNMRISVVLMALVSVILAFNNQSVFELVSIASSFGLVSLFIPFTLTLFTTWVNSSGVIIGMVMGLVSWILFEWVGSTIPSIFYGMLASFIGVMAGQIPQLKYK